MANSSERDWTMDDVEVIIDGGRAGIYDGWVAAVLKDGRIVNRWTPEDYRFDRTESLIETIKIVEETRRGE